MPDPIVVESDILSAVAMSAQKTYKQAQLKIGWKPRPLQAIAEANRRDQGPSGTDGELVESVQLLPDLLSQFWRGSDSIITAQTPRDTVQFATQYVRHVIPITFQHDEWLQKGYDIKPHQGTGSFESRVKMLGEAKLQKIKADLIAYKMAGVNKQFDDLQDLAMHKQGASSKEPVGLNGQLPLAGTGNIYGVDRQSNVWFQHLVRGSAIGASGTLVADIETDLRELTLRNGNAGHMSDFVWLAGGQWIDGYRAESKKVAKWDLDAAGVTKLDTVVLDRAMKIGGEDVFFDPTLADMDIKASSEKGLSISVNAVTFSGGSATTQATGYALVSSGGAVTAIIVSTQGVGYTTAPTVAVATGSSATFQASIYSTSSGTGFTTVQADDSRLGKVSGVAVTAGGTGYTAGDAPLFDKRAYRVPRKVLEYLTAPGIDHRVTVPADSRTTRATELQMETVFYWYNRFIRGCYLSYIK